MYLLRTYYIQGSVLYLLSYFTYGMGFTYWIILNGLDRTGKEREAHNIKKLSFIH